MGWPTNEAPTPPPSTIAARVPVPSPVGRTSVLLVPLAIASRGLAFVVPLVVAMWFGVGPITDAWYWALAFPTFALVLASTALGTAATPAIARTRSEAPQRLPRVVGGLFTWTAIGAGLAGLAICLSAPALLPFLTDFDLHTRALTADFLWELLPFMVLVSSGAVLRVTCEVHQQFFTVAATPFLRASVVIGTTWVLIEPIGPHSLPWGLVAGEVAQLLFWAGVLARQGLRLQLRPHLDPTIRSVGRDLAPILAGEVLVALNLIVDKAFAAQLESGSVATLEYADRARVIPQTLLESTLLMVAYASWSNLRAQDRIAESRQAIDQALRWTLTLAAPCLAGMFIGRHALVALLYERGAFSPEDTMHTASVLGWYLPGVLPTLLGILAVRAHVLERNLTLVFGLGAVSVVGNAVLNAIWMGPLGLQGLALSTTLNMTLIPGLYLWRLRRTVPMPGSRWLRPLTLAALSVGTAVAAELITGPPPSVLDLRLWAWSVPCLLLLGVGALVTRPPGQSATGSGSTASDGGKNTR
jgi:putative peptidoglycan lipid II flippase